MKKISILLATAFTATLFIVSCGKKESIAPTTTPTTTTTTNNNTTTTTYSSTPASFPFAVSRMFLPTGFWGGGDGGGGSAGAVNLTFPTTDTSWYNSIANFTVTNVAQYGGLDFLNNNNWAPKFYFAPGATKLTYDVMADAGVKVVITAFPGVTGISKNVDSIVSTSSTTWVTQTISFTGTYPDSLAGSSFISVAFTPASGAAVNSQYKFALRNVLLSK
ncbi:MAG TPA: hypothetical protein VK766_00485 [Cytophagaceae bacterium]|jgi:hypothetical protein|nr:hypothetical protein [Cytophagaceae bacterium]